MKGFLSSLFSHSSSKAANKLQHRTKASAQARAKSQGIFVKTGAVNTNAQKAFDVRSLSAEQKAHLVKKGTVFLEEGNTTMAHKIFHALKVYDGLMRVSRAYYLQGKMIDAHEVAREAWAQRDVSHMTVAVSGALRTWLASHGLNSIYEQPSKENRHAVLSAYQQSRRSF